MTDEINNENDEGTGRLAPVDPIEELARRRGWKSADEWAGDKSRHISDPMRYLTAKSVSADEVRGEVNKLLSQREAAFNERLERLQKANAAVLDGLAQQQIERVRAAREQAAAAQDFKTSRDLERAEDDIRARTQKQIAELEAPAAPQRQKLQPETEEWIARNKWFDENPRLRGIALAEYNDISASFPMSREDERLREVDRRMAGHMRSNGASGAQTQQTQRAAMPDLEGGGSSRQLTPSKARRILPREAEDAIKRFVGHGLDEKELRAEYERAYFGE